MAFNEALAARIRQELAGQPNVVEKKMFGGLGFMLNGNMVCGVSKNDLMARVGAANHAAALNLPGAREMEMAGRPMRGTLFIDADLLTDELLSDWVGRCVTYTAALPPK